jgi:hypothetical protein
MDRTDSAERTDLLTVRALLDEALIGLRRIEDPVVPVRDALDAVGGALTEVYGALASTEDYGRFQEHARAASVRTQEALSALQRYSTEDPRAVEDMALVAQALGALRHPRLPAGLEVELPRAGKKKPILPASVGEPRLLDVERSVLGATVPLAIPDESVGLVLVDVEAPPPNPILIEAREDLEAFARKCQEAYEAFDATQGGDPPEEKEEEPERKVTTDLEADEELFGVAVTREQMELTYAEELFTELGMYGAMRRPDPGDLWWTNDVVEELLLRNVDALVSCGTGYFPHLVRVLEERPLPDPELAWSAIYLHGSIGGTDALDQVKRLVATSGLWDTPKTIEVRGNVGFEDEEEADAAEDDEEEPLDAISLFDAVTDALVFAPHRGIEIWLREWLGDPDPVRRRAAYHVLGRRRAITVLQCRPGLDDPSPEVMLEAVKALQGAIGDVHAGDLARVLGHRDERIFAAAVESALARDVAAGITRAHHLVREGRGAFGGAAVYTAIGEGADAFGSLMEAAQGGGGPALLEALGWFGEPRSVDLLLAGLQSEDIAIVRTALSALQRITGASLTKDDPDPDYEEHERPFRRDEAEHARRQDQRGPEGRIFMRGYFELEPEMELTADPEIWSAWWAKHGPHARPGVRHRWGNPWTPRDNVWELERSLSLPRERRLAWLELVVRTSGDIPFDERDFVVRQRRQIEQWKQFVAARGERATPGSWPRRTSR